ncbi:glycoside hydrolase family 10 protein [Serinicoccus kebangsaanensis]|uniref:glycoside hydrolase family 10 protein n=1 Tax=Serinicoccus kebangsaanensis TaxID=2602069 RepID=UPI00124C9E90|nr:family 10 glycosylhydrolase [Serinicoccus kebangsaanensis]
MPQPNPRRRRAALALALPLGASLALAAPALASTPSSASAGGPPLSDCRLSPEAPLHEMRGVWIASVANIDWPSQPGLSPQEAQAELLAWYDEAAASGLNSVFVQVRPTADTFWPSELEPSSAWITGEQGADFGGWDPMAFAVEEAHARGLDFHAWFNPYRITLTGTDPSVLAEDHPARVHPDWAVPYGGKLYYDPGVPAVREHTTAVIMEAVERYDIDGVHFDDYFYPYPVAGEEFPDDASFAEFGGDFEDRGDWRRDNVNRLIEGLDRQIGQTKPHVAFGVSPFAVWRNAGTDPEGSDTTAGAQTYDDLYADTRLWVRQEWLDYVLPQVYWAIGFEPAAYDVLVPWWSEQVDGTDVALWIGQATYKVGTSTQSPEWSDPQEMVRHLDLNEQHPQVTGDVYFSAKDVRANRLDHWPLLQQVHYTNPALPPALHPGTTAEVEAPSKVKARGTADGTRLSWRHAGDDAGFAVYRVDDARGPGRLSCEDLDEDSLVAVLGTGDRSWTDTEGDKHDVYVVTALSTDNTQSAPSRPVRGR